MEDWESLLDKLHAEFLLREEELKLLHEIDLRILQTGHPLEEAFKYIVTETQALLGSEHTHVLLCRGRVLRTVYSCSPGDIGQLVPVSHSVTGECFTKNATINVSDLTAPPYHNRYVPIDNYDGPRMRSLLATPIRVQNSTIGVLNAESSEPNAFRPVHERILGAIAAQLAVALQQAQVIDQEKLFAEVDQLIFSDLNQERVIDSALTKVIEALKEVDYVEISGAQILFPREGKLEIVHSTNPSDVGVSVSIEKSICGRAVRERRTIVVGDVSKDAEYLRMLGSTIQSEIAVPILVGGNKIVIGVLNVESEELDLFDGYYRVLIQNFADKVRTLLAFTKLRNDVTEALEVRQANDLMVAIGDQTSHMVHRLNNTVGAMRVRIMQLQEMHEGGIQESNYEFSESLDKLLRLTNRTLEIPRQLTQFLTKQQESRSINESIEHAMEQVEIPAGILLNIDLSENLPPVQLFNFDIVVQNLIQNAIDAMPEGGQINLSTSKTVGPNTTTGYVQLIVRDTGVGIPEDTKLHIFDLNFTTKGDRKGKGLGLGLWWVRNCIRRSGGDITIYSDVGRGSEVVVKIPIDRPAGSHIQELPAHSQEKEIQP